MKFCPECGCKLDSVKKFCPECGLNLADGKKASGGSSINVGDANIRTFQDANIKVGGDTGTSSGGGDGLNINVGDANVRTFEGAQITGTQIGTKIENVNIQGASADDIRKVIAEELSKLNLPKTVAKDTKIDLTELEEAKVKVIAEKVAEADERFGELVSDPQSYVELGNVELLKGNMKQALEFYDKALKLDPENVDAWNNKGYLLTNLGKPEDGLQCTQKATELDPERGMAWNNMGFAQYRLGKIPDARRSFEKSVEIDPGLALAWYNLGILVGNQGGIDEAIFYFEQALEIEPNFEAAKHSKAVCEQYKEMTDAFEGFNDLDNWGFDGVDEEKVDNKGMESYDTNVPTGTRQYTQSSYRYQTQNPYQAQAGTGAAQTGSFGQHYSCPRCRGGLTYYPQYRRYYCYNCRVYI